MYEFKAPFLESRLLALHKASLNGVSSQTAQNLVGNDARFNRFSTRHKGFILVAILSCCIVALSGCGGADGRRARPLSCSRRPPTAPRRSRTGASVARLHRTQARGIVARRRHRPPPRDPPRPIHGAGRSIVRIVDRRQLQRDRPRF